MDISSFPLIWRWTQASHNVLPADVLCLLHPLTTAQIDTLDYSLGKRLAPLLVQHHATDDAEVTAQWLTNLPVHGIRVILVWDKDTALSLPWQTFTKYWSDFCYLASDDLDIFEDDGPLVLKWCHDGTFEYEAPSSTQQ